MTDTYLSPSLLDGKFGIATFLLEPAGKGGYQEQKRNLFASQETYLSTMPSAFFARGHADPLNRFYTRASVGQLLIELIEGFEPRSVIDLGAGDGSLTAAAAQRWPTATTVTVDVDPTCIDNLLGSTFQIATAGHFHHQHNVFDFQLPQCLLGYGGFDLAVCNPPFHRPPWNRDFARILQAANMEDACPSIADVTAELVFFAQNVRLVRPGGVVAFIAPDGLMTGWRTLPFRKYLLRNHLVECVVQLPNHSFHDTEARCFVLVMRNGDRPKGDIRLLRFDKIYGLSAPLLVSREAAEGRLDYEFHAVSGIDGGRTLASLGADVRRGSLGTVEARCAPFPVFHTSDFRLAEAGEIHFPNVSLATGKRLVIAEPGDILMARVDRSLHEKVALVVNGKAPITDCVFRVRVAKKHQRQAFDALRSPTGRGMLKAATKGVSARLLGKADLLSLPLGL